MIKGGYILQPRKIDDSEVMKMPPVTREIWSYILRKVNHKDFKNIKRGSCFLQYNDVQNTLSWHVGYRIERYSKSQIAKSLRRLCEGLMIETTKETRGVLVTVCKYDYYQDPKNYEGNDDGNAKETRRKREGNTIYKNEKNEKKEEEEVDIFSIDYFPGNKELTNTFIEYLKLRKESKYTLTERSINLLIKRLREYSDSDTTKAIKIIETSTINNWKSFYEHK